MEVGAFMHRWFSLQKLYFMYVCALIELLLGFGIHSESFCVLSALLLSVPKPQSLLKSANL